MGSKIIFFNRVLSLSVSKLLPALIWALALIHASVVQAQGAPGGENGNLIYWLKADKNGGLDNSTVIPDVTTNGDPVNTWGDSSANESDFVSAVPAGRTWTGAIPPLFSEDFASFNPSLDFSGGLRFVGRSNGLGLHGRRDFVLYYVGNFIGGDSVVGGHFRNNATRSSLRASNEVQDASIGAAASAPASRGPTLLRYDRDYISTTNNSGAANATATKSLNGAVSGSEFVTNSKFDRVSGAAVRYMGWGLSPVNGSSLGADDIAEVVVYQAPSRNASAGVGSLPINNNRIESYLAVKYGITLGQNMFASGENQAGIDYAASGGALFWDADEFVSTAHGLTFSHDIFGIGRDDVSELGQVISKSINAEAIVTIQAEASGANPGISSDQGNNLMFGNGDETRFAEMDDQEFLMIANNDAAATWTPVGAPAELEILERDWQVQESGEVGTVQIDFDVADADFNVPDFGESTEEYALIIDTDGDGDYADESSWVPLVNTGGDTWSATGIDLDHGQHFTLAQFIASELGEQETVNEYGAAEHRASLADRSFASSSSPSLGDLYLGTTRSLETAARVDDNNDSTTLTVGSYMPMGGQTCTGSNGSYTTAANEFCMVVSVTNTTTVDAQLVGWLDFGAGTNFLADGTFSDAERSQTTVAGAHPDDDGTFTSGNVPPNPTARNYVLVFTGLGSLNEQRVGAMPNQFHARLRLTTDASFFSDMSPQPTGTVSDGEVEDFTLELDTLPVTLSHFNSSQSGKRLNLDWGTASELFNVGFQLWAQDQADGQWHHLHSRLIRSGLGNTSEPQTYSRRIGIPRAIEQLGALGISSIDNDGSEHFYGPFEVGESYGDASALEPIDWANVRAELDAQMLAKGYVRDRLLRYRKLDGGSVTDQDVIEFSVSEPGMYRITGSQLQAAGVDVNQLHPGRLALLDAQGQAVQRTVFARGPKQGRVKTLGVNGEIMFYGQAPDNVTGLYSKASVYRLVTDKSRVLTIPTQDKTRGDVTGYATTYRESSVVEHDRIFVPTSGADDPWLNGIVFAQSPRYHYTNVPIESDLLLDQPMHLELGLSRSSELPSQGEASGAEHIVEGATILTDGSIGLFGRAEAVGKGAWDQSFELPASTPIRVLDDKVIVAARLRPGEGYQFSEVQGDWFGFSYWRPLVPKAGEGHLEFAAQAGQAGYQVDLPNRQGVYIYAIDGDNVQRIPQERVSRQGSGYRVWFSSLAGSGVSDNLRYWVSNQDGFKQVSDLTQRSLPSRSELLAEASGADYLMIAHPQFIGGELTGYADYKRGQGHSVAVVDYSRIVDAFGGGQTGPHGLSQYLQAAEARQDIAHVLLVGGSTYDHTDIKGGGAITHIPAHYRASEFSPYTVSDNAYVTGSDGASFAAIGRWPVRSNADLSAVIAKSRAWDARDRSGDRALLIAEHTNEGEAIDFAAAISGVAGGLPEGMDQSQVFVDEIRAANPDLTLSAALTEGRNQIIEQLNQSPSLVMYNGHASTRQLSNQGLFRAQDIASVDADGSQLWLPLSCYMTYFETTDVNTLAHQLMFTGNAVNITGATLLSRQSENLNAAKLLIDGNINQGQSLGETVEQVRSTNENLNINWGLLGDPSMRF